MAPFASYHHYRHVTHDVSALNVHNGVCGVKANVFDPWLSYQFTCSLDHYRLQGEANRIEHNCWLVFLPNAGICSAYRISIILSVLDHDRVLSCRDVVEKVLP